MSDDQKDYQKANLASDFSAGMTSQALLELIARASTLTLKGVIKSARTPPEKLIELLAILTDDKLITIEGEDTFRALEQIVHDLPPVERADSSASQVTDPLVCGVPTSVIERRRTLIDHLPLDLRPRRITITRKGFGKAFAL